MESSQATRHTRFLVGSTVLLGLIACGLAYGWRRLSGDTETSFLALLIVPASTTIAFLCVGTVVPYLVPGSRFRWPYMLTLPVVYGALLQLCAELWSHGPNPIVKQEFFNRACEFWQRLGPAGALLACQVIVLSAVSSLTGRSA